MKMAIALFMAVVMTLTGCANDGDWTDSAPRYGAQTQYQTLNSPISDQVYADDYDETMLSNRVPPERH
jgi:hypothetical protein